MSKGKVHKKYEFGSKVSVAALPGSNIVVGVKSFSGNPHDSKTLESAIEQVQRLTDREYSLAIVDRGYRGIKEVRKTAIISPNNGRGLSNSQKRKHRQQCRSRSAIEPIIGHMKKDCQMERCYLKGIVGDEINALLAGAAFNMKK